jgi:hypothetical protein
MPVTRAFCLAALAGLLACATKLSFAQHEAHAPAASGARRWTFGYNWKLTGLFIDEGTQRGDRQFALLDWETFGVERRIGDGRVTLGAMTTLSRFINGGRGTPQLLQTGGTYRHAWVHDRMHASPAIMHLGASYFRDGLFVDVLAVGAPRLGPLNYLHRASGNSDPFAPIGHHWQDATHQSFGVVSAGLKIGPAWLSGSAFNAREGDETQPIVDFRGARLDSYAAHLGISNQTWWRLEAWTGFLNEPHRLDPTTRMHRMGASVEAIGPGFRGVDRWTTTAIWGTNVHHHDAGGHAILHAEPGASPHHESRSALLESTLDIYKKGTVFARAELVEKNGEELGFLGGDLTTLYPVQSLVLGGTRELTFSVRRDWILSAGARVSLNFVPEELRATYGTRRPIGMALFLTAKKAFFAKL